MKHLKVFLLTLVLFGFSISPNWAQSDKPILTIGCLSDLHCGEASGSSSSSGTLATSVRTTVQQLKQTENLDAIFVGGDIVSGSSISQDKWNACRTNTIDALLSAFQKSTSSTALSGAKTATPLYIVSGNHEFQSCGTKGSYNSADYYNTVTVGGSSEYGMQYYTNGLTSTTTSTVSANPNEAYYETLSGVTDTNGKNHVACYHYQLNGIDIIGINTSTETYNSASSTPWRYSEGQANWVAKKLELLTQNDKYKRIFVVEHIPFSDNDNGSAEHGLPSSTATSTLKSAMAKCPNLIMFFGHDHSSSKAYISTNTSERVTHYDTNGNKLTKANTQSHKGGSFSSVFMGSMNYRSYQSVYQALLIYVYSDRVELKMKNYGATGNVESSGWYGGSSSTTFNNPINGYTIYMSDGQGSDTPSVDPGTDPTEPTTGANEYFISNGGKYLNCNGESLSLSSSAMAWTFSYSSNQFEISNNSRWLRCEQQNSNYVFNTSSQSKNVYVFDKNGNLATSVSSGNYYYFVYAISSGSGSYYPGGTSGTTTYYLMGNGATSYSSYTALTSTRATVSGSGSSMKLTVPTSNVSSYQFTLSQNGSTPSVDPEPQPATGNGLYLKNMGNSKYLQMVKKATDDANNNNNDGQLGFVSSMDGNTTDWAFTQYNSSSLVKFADSSNSNYVYFGNKGDDSYAYKLTGMAKYNKSGNPEKAADNQSSAGAGSKYNCYLYKINNYSAQGTSFTATLTTTAEAGGYYFIASANIQSSGSGYGYGIGGYGQSSSTGLVLMGNSLSSGSQITLDGTQISSTPGSSSITVNVSNIKNYVYQFVSDGSTPQPTDKTLYGTLSVSGTNGTVFASTTQGAGSGSTSVSVNKSVAQSATSATQTIYLHATANANYTFQGWSETNGGSVISGSNVAEYAYTFTFSGTSQGAATSKTLYAVFQQNGSSDQPSTGGSLYLKNMGNNQYLQMVKKATDTASSNNNDGQLGFVSSTNGTTTWTFTQYSTTKLVKFADSSNSNHVYFGNKGDTGNTYGYKLTGMAKYNKSGNPGATADNQSSAGAGSKYNCYLYKITDYSATGNSFTATLTTTAEAGGYYFIASANIQSSGSGYGYGIGGYGQSSSTGLVLMGNSLSSGSQITLDGTQISSTPGSSSITVNVSNIKNYVYQFVSDGSTPQPTDKTLYGTLSVSGTNGTVFASTTQGAGSGSTSVSVNKSVAQSATSATQTIYLHATANANYTFQGWSETNGGSVISGSNVAEYAYTFTFSGTSQGAATSKTLYAVFQQNGSSDQPTTGDGTYYIKNVNNGTYFTATSSKSSLSSTKQAFTFKSLNNGLYQVSFSTSGRTYAIDYEQLAFSPITPTTNATDNLYFYEIADINASTLTATQVQTVSTGKYYFILGTSKNSGNTYVLSNEPYNNGSLGAVKTTDGSHSSSISLSKSDGAKCIYTLESDGSTPQPTTKTLYGQLAVAATNGSAFISATSGAASGSSTVTVSAEVAADAEKSSAVLYLTATPASDYEFVGWSTDNAGSNIISTVSSNFAYNFEFGGTQTLPTNVTLYAIFKQKSQPTPTTKMLYGQLAVAATNGSAFISATSGAASGSSTVTVSAEVETTAEKSSAVLYLTATPASDYEFVGWSTNNAGSNIISTVSSNFAYTFEFGGTQTLPTNVTLYAIFKQKTQPTPTTKTLYGRVSVSAAHGTAFVTENAGATSGGNVLTVSSEVDKAASVATKTVYLHAKAESGYKFLGWATSSTTTTPLANSAVSEFAYTITFDGSESYPTSRTLYAVFEQDGTPEPLPEDIEPSTDPSEFDYVMYLDDAEASIGTEINLVLNMKNAVNNITGLEFNVCLPEGIKWATTINSRGETTLKMPTMNEERIQSAYHHISVKEISEGVYKVVAYSDDNINILLTGGALLYLPVTVSDDMEDGYYNIYLKDIVMANTEVQQHYVEQTVSYIAVSSYTLGDVNNDGYINVTDIVATVSYLMGENPSPFVFKAADVNTDNEINVTDIVGIIDIINGQGSSKANAANGMRSGSYQDAEYALDLVADGQNVTLNMNNSDYITAFQCDVELSDGVEWISENGRLAMPEFNEEAGRTDRNYHSISVKRLDDGKIRIIVYSLNNDEFFGTEGAVLNLPLAFTKGASCSISNIVLAKKNAESEYLNGNTYSFDATNINYIQNAQDANDVIFDINGVRSNKLMKGIYIINGAKVMVNE